MNNEITENRRWRSSPEISKELAQHPYIESIREISALWRYIRAALPVNDYKASSEWEHIIVLTSAGHEALQLSGVSQDQRYDRADILMAMFCVYFHHGLLIDWEKCDLKALHQLVNAELLSGRLRWPHRFGRLLYDKFNDSYSGDRTDHLLPDEALTLLEGTSQGVYQVGQLVSGPFGLIEALCARYIPPSRNLLLWHCSDPGCQSAHTVNLLPIEVPFVQIIHRVEMALDTILGPASEWPSSLTHLLGKDIYLQPYTYYDVSTIIADCIVSEERASLVTAALMGSNGSFLRDVLCKPPRKKASGQGAAEALAKALTDEEQLQLLFLLKDSDLIELIDQCTNRGTIRVPLAEKRMARFPPPAHVNTPTSELSSLGIRCSGFEPLLDFCALVWEAYSSSGRTSDLDWRLHNRLGSGTQNMLLDYLCKTEPSMALKELVLASEPVTKAICEKLKYSLEDLNDRKHVDRLLWKLGFDLPRFSDTLTLLKRSLDLFSQELLAVGTLKEERDRERIRSVGVNLFVSVEVFLEELVCFNVWLLASDHFLKTKFRYDVNAARLKVSDVLGPILSSGDITVAWSTQNTNTLGTLMAYLNATAEWMNVLPGYQKEALLRTEGDLPDFADDKLRVFPFRHTTLWADSDLGHLERLAVSFADMVAKIARSNLAAIRNGLDHQRDETGFPGIDEMLAFVAHLREAVDVADINRFFPKEFWLEKTHEDRFGRQEFELKDYFGRSHVFFGPSFVQGIPGISADAPFIIAPGNLLGFANAEIMFAFHEPSTYSRYWESYPRRRQIPNGHTRVAEIQSQEANQSEILPLTAG